MKTIFIAAATALVFFSSCGNKNGQSSADSSAAKQITVITDTAASHSTAAVKYQCPMKCEGEKTYDKPGPCPECGMTMKEVK